MRFAPCKECERARLERGKDKLQHRQSRWLSKERGCGRDKVDRCQNKGDSQTGPNWDGRDTIEGEFREKRGRTVRMELDYTRQCTTVSFTKSRSICIVCKLMLGRDLASVFRLHGGQRPVCLALRPGKTRGRSILDISPGPFHCSRLCHCPDRMTHRVGLRTRRIVTLNSSRNKRGPEKKPALLVSGLDVASRRKAAAPVRCAAVN